MKNKLIGLFLAFCLSAGAAVPTSVRKADKAEYAAYKEYCAKVVSKLVTQDGKQTLLKKDGYYKKPDGTFTVSSQKRYWYKIGATEIICNDNEVAISRKVVVNEPRRKASVKDFYTWWMPAKYQAEIKRLEAAIADPLYAPEKEKFTKQLNFIKQELAKIK